MLVVVTLTALDLVLTAVVV